MVVKKKLKARNIARKRLFTPLYESGLSKNFISEDIKGWRWRFPNQSKSWKIKKRIEEEEEKSNYGKEKERFEQFVKILQKKYIATNKTTKLQIDQNDQIDGKLAKIW